MFQTRCYTCGHKLHDGPPRLEELADDQFAIVTDRSRTLGEADPNLYLAATPLAGMSWSQFCSDCQDIIRSCDPRLWNGVEGHTWTQRRPDEENPFLLEFLCTCGYIFGLNTDLPAANRAKYRHYAEALAS